MLFNARIDDHGWFNSHGHERANEKDHGAKKLRCREPLVKNQCGKEKRAERTKQLEALRQCHAKLLDRHITAA
jgi:hypothetical protein